MKKTKIVLPIVALLTLVFASPANAAVTVNSTGFTGTSALTIQPASPASFLPGDSLVKIHGVQSGALSSEPIEVRAYGFANMGMGYQAMMNMDGGTENTVYGYHALKTTAFADDNSAFGVFALELNTFGDRNTALGGYALSANTTGDNNTSVGYQSLQSNEIGVNNVAVGRMALQSSSSSNNIAIGYGAGDNISSGANNIVIGYDIDAPSGSTSNQMTIGNLIFGTGLDGTGTTVSNGKVGIKTNAPTDIFDVNADNIRIRTSKTPASAAAACDQGEVSWDSSYIYICTATNTWKRAAIATW